MKLHLKKRKKMQRKEILGLNWLEYDLLSDCPNVKHGTFLRSGGHSSGDYSGLNLAYGIGDREQDVANNIETLKEALDLKKVYWADQEHCSNIHHLNPLSPQKSSHCDAFITNTLNHAAMIKHADCQASIFYDPIHHAIANIHSGWRGSVLNIYSHVLKAMNQRYGTKASDVLACISPSLGPNAAQFKNYKNELPEYFWDFKSHNDKFDFWAITEKQLQDCGVLSHHIEIAKICTYENTKDCYSFRRNKITGRHGTIAMLT
jgi:YfiH family protein